MIKIEDTAERKRLVADSSGGGRWKKWGPYLSDRQWGTVREDYSPDGSAWDYFSHDESRSRAYRWGEDGIMGISDNHQRLCFAIALWNGKDAILKERLFGLTNTEGNHGEDVKEYYFNLESTPNHSYMKGMYKYPHNAFPYQQLIEENGRRKHQNSPTPESEAIPEFELIDTGIFDENRYFDVFVEYAKNSPEDILIQITVVNHGPDAQELHLAPTLWFRNTWSWGDTKEGKPSLESVNSSGNFKVVKAQYKAQSTDLKSVQLVEKWLYCETPDAMLYTENETNKERFNWGKNDSSYVKDGIHNYIVNRQTGAVNHQKGTKVSPHYRLNLAPGETKVVRLRLSDIDDLTTPFGSEFGSVFEQRKSEADQFYQAITPYEELPAEMRNVQRQAFAGLLWTKQYYHYVVQDWIKGDPGAPPPDGRKNSLRNSEWTHLFNEDIISMPDKWEYPWFAAWDLAFHTIPLALIDPEFAKKQLYLFTREWYMHPNGQIPAYEWNFGDVNPPVHAWAAWRVYKIEEKMYGKGDKVFLEQLFQKMSLYFTWWVNRKDVDGNNLFGGGFLGLDNIGVFDRSNLNIADASIEQADGTSWMAMFCLNLLKMATELAKICKDSKIYDDMASKYFQHFLLIAEAMNKLGGDKVNLWDDKDNFFYDILKVPAYSTDRGFGSFSCPMKVRSMVGLIPLFAVEIIDQETLENYLSSDFKKRADWFLENRPDLTENIYIDKTSSNLMKGGLALSLVTPERLKLILKRMLDEAEFLGKYGIRGLSKHHKSPYELPFVIRMRDGSYQKPWVQYEPAESKLGLFGGNSNWRGPIWMPVNFLIVESLQKFHYYLGDDFKVEYPSGPSGSKKMMNLWEVSTEISQRLINIFLPESEGSSARPVYGGAKKFQEDPNWNQYILFYEYFHGDNGAGIGSSHQTGWTGIVAKLIQQHGAYTAQGKNPQ
ncbi:MAG: MGH1-like glycoside hydrolase domain-containing protein [Dolichospermum sp.]